MRARCPPRRPRRPSRSTTSRQTRSIRCKLRSHRRRPENNNMASIEVKVPDIGDFDEVSVIEVLVKPGDTVKAEQSLVTVESDKASMEIPSSSAGVVKELRVKLGDKIAEGSLVLMLEASTDIAAGAGPSPQPSPANAGEGAKSAASSALAPAQTG